MRQEAKVGHLKLSSFTILKCSVQDKAGKLEMVEFFGMLPWFEVQVLMTLSKRGYVCIALLSFHTTFSPLLSYLSYTRLPFPHCDSFPEATRITF